MTAALHFTSRANGIKTHDLKIRYIGIKLKCENVCGIWE